jgi:hypothetical protein
LEHRHISHKALAGTLWHYQYCPMLWLLFLSVHHTPHPFWLLALRLTLLFRSFSLSLCVFVLKKREIGASLGEQVDFFEILIFQNASNKMNITLLSYFFILKE